MRHALAAAAFLLACSCASASPERTDEVSIHQARHPVRGWPFLDIQRSEDLRTTTTEVLWPLFEHQSGPEAFSLKLRPVLSWTQAAEARRLWTFPTFWWWDAPEDRGFHAWPVFSRWAEGAPGGAKEGASVAWPLFQYRYQEGRPGWRLDFPAPLNDLRVRDQGGMLRLGRIPLVFTLLDVGTTGRTRWEFAKLFNSHLLSLAHGKWQDGYGETVVFPVYWHTEQPDHYRLHVWPIAGYSRTGTERTVSIAWPLYSQTMDEAKGRFSVHAAGPLISAGHEGDRSWFNIFPVLWAEHWPVGHRWILAPVFADYASGGTRVLILAPLWLDWKTGARRTRALTPLAWWWERPGYDGSLVFPFWYHAGQFGDSILNSDELSILSPNSSPNSAAGVYVYTTLLVPFWFADVDREGSDRVLFPLWWRRVRGDDTLSAFTPLAWSWSGPDGSGLLALPLAGRWQSGNTVQEFLLPLYGSSRGPESETTVLFPLYGRLRRGDVQLTAITPLVWRGAGPESKGWGVFPFYANVASETQQLLAVTPLYWRSKGPQGRTDVLLPLLWHSRGDEGGTTVAFPIWWDFRGKESRTSVLAPLWMGRRRQGGWAQDWVLGPVFTRTNDPERREKSVGLLWPLGAWQRGPEKTHLRALPLFWHTRWQDESHATVVFPVWWSFGSRWSSTAVAPPLWFERRTDKSLWQVLIPAYLRRETETSRTRIILPALIQHQSGSYSANFYGLNAYGVEEDEQREVKRRHILWPLASWGHAGARTEGHVVPLAWWRNEHDKPEDPTRSRLLFPLWWEDHADEADHFQLFPIAALKTRPEPGHWRAGIGADLFRWTERPDGWRIDAPWPLLSVKSGEDGWAARLTPIVSIERFRESSRTMLLPLVYAQSRGTGQDTRSWGVVPPALAWWKYKGYDRKTYVLGGIYRDRRTLGHCNVRLLWKLMQYKRNYDDYDFRVLHRVVRVARQGSYHTREFAPFWAWEKDEAEDYEYWSVLRFLVSYERYKGRRELRFFYFLRLGLD